MPTIDFTDGHAAVTRAVRRALDEDRYPLAPRLAPLRSALAKLDPGSAPKPIGPRPPLPRVGNRRGKAKRYSREENMFYDIVTHPLAHPIVSGVGLIVIVGWAWWWWRKV